MPGDLARRDFIRQNTYRFLSHLTMSENTPLPIMFCKPADVVKNVSFFSDFDKSRLT